jgi:hypothetical protein
VLLDQEQGPVPAARLLVGHGGEDDVAVQGRALALQQHQRHQAHRHHVLHVDGAAAPDVAALLHGGEGRVLPVVVVGGDHVQVPAQQQRRLAPAPLQARDHAGPPRRALQDLRRDPLAGQGRRHQLGGGALVAGRVAGVDPQQVLQAGQGLGRGSGPVDVAHGQE